MAELDNRILLESDTNELEIVEFRVDELAADGTVLPCYFGVNVAKVREIIKMPELYSRAIHGNSAEVAGIIKLRDKVITMVDLATLLGKAPTGTQAGLAIILEFNGVTAGIMVDAVSRIYRISWQAVEPPATTMHGTNITGIVKMDDRIILLLDFEKIIGEICFNVVMHPLGSDQLDSPLAVQRAAQTVLVADDSTFIRDNVVGSLRSAGYQVVEAVNGEDAWTELCRSRDAGRPYAMLITDVEMPRVDGLHLTSLVRKDPALKDLPVAIFSSLASADNKAKWQGLAASAILTKPDLPALVAIVDHFVLGQPRPASL